MIEWIVTSSALILLVVILRVVIKGRVSPRLRYALWGLVLLRLVIPGTLWESKASVMTPVAAQESYQTVERVPRYVRTQPDGWVEIGHPNSGNWTSIPPESEAVSVDRPTTYEWFDPEEEVSLTELRKQVDLRDAFRLVWLGGSAAVGVFLLAVNLKFDRNLKKKRRMLEPYRGRWVFIMEGLPTPCLFGLFRPAIYLTGAVAEDETAKAHVLAHEYAHFRQWDHIWAVLRGVCLAIHWYNPLVWLAAYLSRRDCELSCDEGAVRLLGEDRRADYGRTLVGLVARRTTPKDLACCATTMTGGKSALKERIALLVKHPRTTAWMACIVAAACIVFVVCTFTGAAAEEAKEPEPDAPEEVLPVDDEDLPDLADLPTELDWAKPIWLLEQIRPSGEYIAVYQDAETGVNYLRKGDRLQKLETRNLYDRQQPKGIQLLYRDLDGDGAEELAIYQSTFFLDTEGRTLLICEWDGQRWTEHRPEGIVPALVQDFRDNHTISEIHVDPGMGETPGPSILAVNWNGLSAAFEVSSWALKTGGTLACGLDERQYVYHVGQDGGIELVIYGEASYADSPVKDSKELWFACPVVYQTDGTFALGPGALNTRPPENLPTEPMDLTRPAEEQGPWLLLAQAPTTDAALYRSAWDDQHVYLRVTNMSFQAFERDLSGMELLPTLDLWHGDADYAVQALYRRYEGTYFNGTSYEPGIVADQRIYILDDMDKFWTEARISPSAPLTEDVPAIADLPTEIIGRGSADVYADILLLGESPEAGIAVYYEQSTDKTWLRYGDAIQSVDKIMYPMLLYWEDLDGDGDRELAVISTVGRGTGVCDEQLTVYEWDGQAWSWATHTPDETIEDFNNDLDLIFEFYEDGTAFIKNRRSSILLDLSDLWESGYWESPPKKCELSQWWNGYTYEDGQITLTIAGGLWNEELYQYDYIFDYVCPVVYMEHGGGSSYLGSGVGVLRSEYAVEPEPPELTDTWRKVLEKILAECDPDYPDANVYAVHDVNGDGEDELIVIWNSMPTSVYSRNTDVYNAKGKVIFGALGELTYYSNGAISTPWSHNQGAACAMWPYDLYVYGTYAYNSYQTFNTGVVQYTKAGSARARSDDAPGFEDLAYADLDGDGVVYYIGTDAYKEDNPVDNAVYEAWLDQYLAGAQVLPVQYFPLTEETISK